MPRFQYVFSIGDVKPIVLTSVVSSTGATIISASCTLVDHSTSLAVGSPNQVMTVSGQTITSPYFSWTTVGEYIVQVRVTFTDGVVDNSITILVQVQAVPT